MGFETDGPRSRAGRWKISQHVAPPAHGGSAPNFDWLEYAGLSVALEERHRCGRIANEARRAAHTRRAVSELDTRTDRRARDRAIKGHCRGSAHCGRIRRA